MSNEIEKLRIAESQTETQLTPEQKESGNYKKGEVNIKGFDIVIENPKGSVRSGVDENGKPWSCELENTYGYFKGTEGSDGDEVDIFIGDDIDKDFKVYVIDQINPETREFDEHKVMFGFEDSENAIDGYFDNYCTGWDGFGSMIELSLSDFNKWLVMRKKVFTDVTNAKNVSVSDFAEKRTKIIQLEGEVIEYVTLEDLKLQAGESKEFDTLILEIASNGGSVTEGIKTMIWLNSLSTLGKRVVTVVTANAYSIASLIMLSASHRVIGVHADVMVHNPMLPEIKLANAEALEVHAKELRDLEGVMYKLYQIFTGLSEEIIKKLMDEETFFGAEKAKEYGFVDEIANLEERPKAMAVNKQKITNMIKLTNALNMVISEMKGTKAVNQTYHNDEGGSIEIYQQEMSGYQVGDMTNVKSVTVTLSDGAIVKVDDTGKIEDIDRSKIVASTEGVEGEPAGDPEKGSEGTPVTTEGTEGAPAEEKTTEVITEDARARAKAKAQAEAETKDAEMKAKAQADEEILAKAKAIQDQRAQAEGGDCGEAGKDKGFNETPKPAEAVAEGVSPEEFQALVLVVGDLKKEVEDLKAQLGTTAKAVEEGQEFEKVATQAIQTLAENVSSDFQPDAKAVFVATEGSSRSTSIFGKFVNKK